MRPFVFDYTICFVFCQVFVTCFLKVFLCDVCHIVVGGLVGLVGLPGCCVGLRPRVLVFMGARVACGAFCWVVGVFVWGVWFWGVVGLAGGVVGITLGWV